MGFADQWVMDGLLEVANCYNCSTHTKKKEKKERTKENPICRIGKNISNT
jgi:hypothetical protein